MQDDIHHPIPGDTGNGSALEEGPEDNTIRILTWSGYSSGEGEYSAYLSKWQTDEDKQQLVLVHTSRKQPYSPWDESMPLSVLRLPDQHKRLARTFARDHWHLKRARDVLTIA